MPLGPIAFAAVAGLSACNYNSPTWRRDHIEVTGSIALDGTCQISIDGQVVPGLHARYSYRRDYVENIGVPSGASVKNMSCSLLGAPEAVNGAGYEPASISFAVTGPIGTVPQIGNYAVSDSIPPGAKGVAVILYAASVHSGAWPFAFDGVHLTGYSGALQLSAVDSVWVNPEGNMHDTVRVAATFRFLRRRQASSGGY